MQNTVLSLEQRPSKVKLKIEFAASTDTHTSGWFLTCKQTLQNETMSLCSASQTNKFYRTSLTIVARREGK